MDGVKYLLQTSKKIQFIIFTFPLMLIFRNKLNEVYSTFGTTYVFIKMFL